MVNNLTHAIIDERLSAAGFEGDRDTARLARYLDLLVKWNKKTNLTSLPVDPLGNEAVDRLIVEPVIASAHLAAESGQAIDLGSGGGSPAIPLGIQLPRIAMKMVESRSRKCAFLREAIRTVELAAGSVEESRFELLFQRAGLHQTSNSIVVRAVRFDDQLVRLMRYLLVPGGTVYRFASLTESDVPESVSVRLTVPLIPSSSSLLQLLALND